MDHRSSAADDQIAVVSGKVSFSDETGMYSITPPDGEEVEFNDLDLTVKDSQAFDEILSKNGSAKVTYDSETFEPITIVQVPNHRRKSTLTQLPGGLQPLSENAESSFPTGEQDGTHIRSSSFSLFETRDADKSKPSGHQRSASFIDSVGNEPLSAIRASLLQHAQQAKSRDDSQAKKASPPVTGYVDSIEWNAGKATTVHIALKDEDSKKLSFDVQKMSLQDFAKLRTVIPKKQEIQFYLNAENQIHSVSVPSRSRANSGIPNPGQGGR